MTMTQRYAGMLRRQAGDWDTQAMPVQAECCRQAARHMEELQAKVDAAESPWQPIATAPRDGTPIVGWCVHAADPYYLEGGKKLTIYGGHTEGMGHVEDGPHVVVWGGGFDDSTWDAPGAWMPDWWFQYGSAFEVTANPTHWMPLPAPPEAPNA